MEEQTNYAGAKTTNWGKAIANARFRNKLIIGVAVLIGILMFFPHFFKFIEARKGVVLNDVLLPYIRPMDLSVPIFITIWSTTLLFFFRGFFKPQIFINGVYCFCLLTIVRMISIYFTPLDPPATIIAIRDPLTSLGYGGKDVFITKDLFFSGHTSNILMLALCFEKKIDRLIGFVAALLVGTMVLFQHVHYTIDVLAAFIITGFIVMFGKKLAEY